jgi:hypothetical protein
MGPLVALAQPRDQHHEACRQASQTISSPLFTVWPVITEALYLLRHETAAGPLLLGQIERGHLEIAGPNHEDVKRIRELMVLYEDLPMDFADASLVVLCERLQLSTVFTIDQRDFSVYRPAHVRRFKLIP